MHGHRVTSLKTVPEPTSEDEGTWGPREGSLLQSNCCRELEERAYLAPNCLCQRARIDKVAHRLPVTRTVEARLSKRVETSNASTERQRVKQEFVERLLVLRRPSAVL